MVNKIAYVVMKRICESRNFTVNFVTLNNAVDYLGN